MKLTAYQYDEILYTDTYYSVGGGFIVDQKNTKPVQNLCDPGTVPYPFCSAQELLDLCQKHQLRVSEVMMGNEKTWRNEKEIREKLLHIWQVMQECVNKGILQKGELPGGLGVQRRAHEQFKNLQVLGPQPMSLPLPSTP